MTSLPERAGRPGTPSAAHTPRTHTHTRTHLGGGGFPGGDMRGPGGGPGGEGGGGGRPGWVGCGWTPPVTASTPIAAVDDTVLVVEEGSRHRGRCARAPGAFRQGSQTHPRAPAGEERNRGERNFCLFCFFARLSAHSLVLPRLASSKSSLRDALPGAQKVSQTTEMRLLAPGYTCLPRRRERALLLPATGRRGQRRKQIWRNPTNRCPRVSISPAVHPSPPPTPAPPSHLSALVWS